MWKIFGIDRGSKIFGIDRGFKIYRKGQNHANGPRSTRLDERDQNVQAADWQGMSLQKHMSLSCERNMQPAM